MSEICPLKNTLYKYERIKRELIQKQFFNKHTLHTNLHTNLLHEELQKKFQTTFLSGFFLRKISDKIFRKIFKIPQCISHTWYK